MSVQQHLRQRDLRSIYLLVGECYELGADPIAWRQHMLIRLGDLLLAIGVALAEGSMVVAVGSEGAVQSKAAINVDAVDDRKRNFIYRHGRQPPFSVNRRQLARSAGEVFHSIQARRDLVAEAPWCQLQDDHYLRRTGSDYEMNCVCRNQFGTRSLTFVRECPVHPFEHRDQRLVKLFLSEISDAPVTRLAAIGDPSVVEMAPRLRQVMQSLLVGDSEKQAAAQLGISPHTVHEYIQRLYRRFGASSRSELMARCARYMPVLTHNADLVATNRALRVVPGLSVS